MTIASLRHCRVQLPSDFQRHASEDQQDIDARDTRHIDAHHTATAAQLHAYADALEAFLAKHASLWRCCVVDMFCQSKWWNSWTAHGDGSGNDDRNTATTSATTASIAALFMPCHGATDTGADMGAPTILPDDWAHAFADPSVTTAELCALARDGTVRADWPATFRDFVRDVRRLSLPREPHALFDAWERERLARPKRYAEHRGMSGKKVHEVERMARFIKESVTGGGVYGNCQRTDNGTCQRNDNGTCQRTDNTIVDFGSGQGYLSSLLHMDYGFGVVSVDGDPIQTRGSRKRYEYLKALQAKKRERDRKRGVAESPCHGDVGGCGAKDMDVKQQPVPAWHHTTRRIGIMDQLPDLLQDMAIDEQEHDRHWSICGLHCCGDLSSSMLRVFSNDRHIHAVINVGCCYHLISTEDDKLISGDTVPPLFGYPLSQHLTERKSTLSLTGRMLACQSPWRWGVVQSTDEVTAMFRKHLFRCMLQVLLVRGGVINANAWDGSEQPTTFFKNIPAKYSGTFEAYVRAALSRMGVELVLTADGDEDDEEAAVEGDGAFEQITFEDAKLIMSTGQFTAFVDRYETYGQRLVSAVWTIRALLGPVVESLILIDRLLYVGESADSENVEDVALLPLFDPDVSPRNMVLLARRRRSTTDRD